MTTTHRTARPTAALLALGLSACGLTAGAGLSRSTPSSTPSDTSTEYGNHAGGGPLVVPDVIGRTADEARAIARASGFVTEVEINPSLSCEDEPHDAGRVSCQSPLPGRQVNRAAWIQIAVYAPPTQPGVLGREELKPLIGMTVAQARQYLARMGYDGALEIGTITQYQARCGQDRICNVPRDGGVGLHDDFRLEINPTLETAEPQP